jgi:hypothetical protein
MERGTGGNLNGHLEINATLFGWWKVQASLLLAARK